MFQKVLISDDLGSINIGVTSVLESLSVPRIDKVQYCDDAYLKLKAAFNNQEPYDLFITDLSFEIDHRSQQFTSGDLLIEKLKLEHPNLKIIVFSVEDRLLKVRSLMKDYHLDGYVCKGRKGMMELREAIKSVSRNKQYASRQIRHALGDKTNLEIDEYDIQLVKHLSNGLTQDEISAIFKENNTSPNSLSSIEKHLNKLRIQFKANNAIHLIAIVKDLGLI